MAPHSSPLAWKITWMEEPGGLQSMGSLSRIRLSNFTFTFHFHALEKEMATHSSVLAWRVPGIGEPGGLPSMGSRRVGHDWSDSAAAVAATTALIAYLLPSSFPASVKFMFLFCFFHTLPLIFFPFTLLSILDCISLSVYEFLPFFYSIEPGYAHLCLLHIHLGGWGVKD